MWEFTTLEGSQKLEAVIEQQSRIFEQLKRTGSNIPITMMPGNHDYELAAYPEFIERLKDFNVNLVPEVSIVREVAGKKVWIEHGQQHDNNNRMPDFGNPYAQPVGYFVTTSIVGTAGRHSEFGRGNWLKDVQAVSPLTGIPTWMASNYFYREMGPFLRLVLVPFLLLFGLGAFVVLGGILEAINVFDSNPVLDNPITDLLGLTGDVLRAVLWINGFIFLLLVLAGIPLGFIFRDLSNTLKRYNLVSTETPLGGSDKPYIGAAKEVFASDSDVVVFIYGHTHRASLKHVEGRVVINTGTWLKLPEKAAILFGKLPPVYYPEFHLNYFKIVEEDGQVVVYYETIDKEALSELTLLQRLLTVTKRRRKEIQIPKRTGVDGS